jgi:ribosome assembly protein 1
VEIQPSEPIPFRETAVKAPGMFRHLNGVNGMTFAFRQTWPPPKTPGFPRGTVHGASFQNLVTFTIRAVPLPEVIADFLRSNLVVIKRLLADWTRSDSTPSEEVEDEAEKAATTGDILRVPTVHPGAILEHCKPSVTKRVLSGPESSTISGLSVPKAQGNVF